MARSLETRELRASDPRYGIHPGELLAWLEAVGRDRLDNFRLRVEQGFRHQAKWIRLEPLDEEGQ